MKTRLPPPGVLVLALIAAAPPARSVEPLDLTGWTVSHAAQPNVCVASGPKEFSATLDLAAQGGQFAVMIETPDLPQARASYPLTLTVGAQDPLHLTAVGASGVAGAPLGDAVAASIGAASRVTVGINGSNYVFAVSHAGAALDAVARCAGAQTLVERMGSPPTPIPHAGGWGLSVTLPGTPGRACMARVSGPQVDTLLVLNREGEVVLMAGHPDWTTWTSPLDVSLGVDGAPPWTITASAINALVVVKLTDPARIKRLEAARSIDWTLPTGRFRGDVTGLGKALVAVRACRAGTDAPAAAPG